MLVDAELGGRPRALVVIGEPQRRSSTCSIARPASSCSARLREADVGEGPRRTRPADPDSRHGAVGEGHARLSEPAGLDQLVEPVLQPGDRHALRAGPRDGIDLLQDAASSTGPARYYTGGSEKRLDEESWGAVRALDVKTGEAAWDFRLPSPPWAGVMATAGGLVFGGSNEGNFFALDATTGKPLGSFRPAARSAPDRCRFSSTAGSTWPSPAGRGFFVFALDAGG